LDYNYLHTFLKNKNVNLKYLAILVLGILFMVASSWFVRSGKDSVEEKERPFQVVQEESKKDMLQRELEDILEQLEGIEKVSVLINFQYMTSYEYALNKDSTGRKTQEDDGAGGTRTIEELITRDNYVILRDAAGVEKPLLLQENQPVIKGVLIVANGVEYPTRKEQIVRALVSLLQIPPHRITVLPGGK